MKPGTVTFAGAGPGAVDLLTLRCRDAIAQAETIVYAGSLVNPETLQFASPQAEIFDSAGMTLDDTTRVLVAAARQGKRALRLHTGDPAVYGAIAEQIARLDAAGVPWEIIPGVSSVFAAAAAAGCELTLPGVSQTVILTRRAGRTPVPAGQELPALAAHGATLALFLSAGDMPGLVADLRAGGYADDTPVVVVHRASWPDEKIVRGTLATIASQFAAADISRQALVLVGRALAGDGEPSRLYDAGFSHGYRGRTTPLVPAQTTPAAAATVAAPPPFTGRVALVALTAAGSRLAASIATATGGDLFLPEKHLPAAADPARRVTPFDPATLGTLLAGCWKAYDALVLVMATGIAVRKLAPLLRDKTADPAAVVCDETGRFAISLVGGHIGGGNRLARQVAAAIGAAPVVTTATDAQGLLAFDELAAGQGWEILNPAAIKPANAALLANRPVGFFGPPEILARHYARRPAVQALAAAGPFPADLAAIVAVDPPAGFDPGAIPALRLRRQPLCLGIGCRRGTTAEEIAAAVETALAAAGLEPERVAGLASVDAKQDEPGLITFAGRRALPLRFYPATELAAVPVPTPSSAPAKAVGTPSVAEAAALRLAGAGGRLLWPKQIRGRVTVAVAVAGQPSPPATPRQPSGALAAVGIGGGTWETLTGEALEALGHADVIVGYGPYCDQVRPFFPAKRFLSSGMTREVERCRAAIAECAEGRNVAVISSGDAGVYGMAGLLLELLAERPELAVELRVVPGITAALAAAAVLGAPFMNDFAVISLSDLLTDRETILRRLEHTAQAGIPCALYNPRSQKRRELFDQALDIFRQAYGAAQPCGFVRNAGRDGQERWVGALADLPVARIDMSTLVVIGGSQSCILGGRLLTRRGYAKRMDE
ncbi:MAG: precorrin-4 C(11)-methyltransferase [Lentisphaeria bacterium]|jgi:cobalt-precorrin 5A hydrolase/precorrin-3B C17-methyltransferase